MSHPVAMLLALALGAASPTAPARAPAPAAGAPAKAGPPANFGSPRKPLTLDAQQIEGRAESPRVLFVHSGPSIALEDAPKHPSYLRDDFSAALASPIRVHVRPFAPLVLTPAPGGNR